jgi:hypothetical protein
MKFYQHQGTHVEPSARPPNGEAPDETSLQPSRRLAVGLILFATITLLIGPGLVGLMAISDANR